MAESNHSLDTSAWATPCWKHLMRHKCKCGVYAIYNIVNGKLYIGGAKTLYRRKKRHLLSLRKGIHHNPNLQQDWIEFGEVAFCFGVIEYVEDYRDLRSREQFWLDHYGIQKYNRHSDATSARGCYPTEETRMKMSAAHKGKGGWRHSEETKKRLSESRKAFLMRKRETA